MAVLSSHTLNGTDGSHAGGIPVTLTNLTSGRVLMRAEMDAGGRLSREIAPEKIDTQAQYELLFDMTGYWAARGMVASVGQIALRFAMTDAAGAYHLPVIVNPNSYSMWSSA